MEDHTTDDGFYAQWRNEIERFQGTCGNYRVLGPKRVVSDAAVLVGLADQYIEHLRAKIARMQAE